MTVSLAQSSPAIVIIGLVPMIHVSASAEFERMSKAMYVYILASKKNGTLYIGVTNDIVRRVYEHRENLIDGFTKRYSVHRLVYFEIFDDPERAIQREKTMKRYIRQWKINLIEEKNPDWSDLYEGIAT